MKNGAFEDENIVATENAISTLGRFIYFHKDDKVITDQLVAKFVGLLPLKSEE